MCAMAQNKTPADREARPFAMYQRPIRAACSSRFYQDEEIRTNPGLRHDSKTPRKNRAAAKQRKSVALPVAANTTPEIHVRAT